MVTEYTPKGVCSRHIRIETDGDVIRQIEFEGGCNGNLKGIAALCEGQKIEDVLVRIKGLTCGFKKTSCPDQLAHALESIQSVKTDSGNLPSGDKEV